MRMLVILTSLSTQIRCSAPSETARGVDAADETSSPFSTVSGRAPAGAIISLEPAAGSPPPPQGPAVMDQFSKAFIPETLFARVGQPVVFKNSEDQLHDVTVTRTRTGTGVFNVSQNQGDTHTHTFEQPGEYTVNCDVHPGMTATVVVTTTPFAVYSTPRGTFEVPNVPAGQYTLRVLSDGAIRSRSIDVRGRMTDVGDAMRAGS